MTASRPRVSVIVPVYNGAEHLPQTINSVLAQTYDDFELVAVDDGWVVLRAKGSCVGCHAQATTLAQALEKRLRERCAWLAGLRTVP